MKNNDINNVTKSENSSKIYSRKILSVIGVVLLVATFGATAGISVPDIDAGQNGFKINSGTLDVGSGDITASDGGTTIWDQSAGNIPDSVTEYDYFRTSGDTLSGNLDMSGGNINNGGTIRSGDVELEEKSGYAGSLIHSSSTNYNLLTWTDVAISTPADSNADKEFHLQSKDGILLTADSESDQHRCSIAGDTGDWTCDGTKSWRHQLNSTHNAFYTSQESPDVRAVFEGQTTVTDSKRVELPGHFSNTVSDTEPKMRAQVTPRGTLTNAAAMEVTDEYIDIKVGKETKVDYRVTGIREGYEDKQVVREKE